MRLFAPGFAGSGPVGYDVPADDRSGYPATPGYLDGTVRKGQTQLEVKANSI